MEGTPSHRKKPRRAAHENVRALRSFSEGVEVESSELSSKEGLSIASTMRSLFQNLNAPVRYKQDNGTSSS